MIGKSIDTRFEYQIEARQDDGTWAQAYPMNFTSRDELNTTLEIMQARWPKRTFRRVEVEITRRAMDTESSRTVRELAHERDDFHVNHHRVKCVMDTCSNSVHRLAGDPEHPWDVAQEHGWERIWPNDPTSTDLLCSECAPQHREWLAKFEAQRAAREQATK